MAKPPLSMKPTGWFQVAWSDEVGVGDVHRMKYFDRELIAWRAQSGRVTVMDAYCEHLGAHLGFGGHVEGEVIECPFHGWQWNAEGRNVCIPYEPRPNRGRRMRTYPVVERNESIYIWHDVEGREPFFDAPDVFASFGDGSSAADYYPQAALYREAWSCIRSTCSRTASTSRTSSSCTRPRSCPVFTRHDFAEPVSYVDFTITFEGDENQSIDDVRSGVEAINGGLGIAVTKSSGMVDNRTISAITPVDEYTSDVRFTVYIGRTPGKDTPRAEARRHRSSARRSSASSARTSTSGRTNAIRIRQRCRRRSTRASPRSASGPVQFYPDGRGGSAADLHAATSTSRRPTRRADLR